MNKKTEREKKQFKWDLWESCSQGGERGAGSAEMNLTTPIANEPEKSGGHKGGMLGVLKDMGCKKRRTKTAGERRGESYRLPPDRVYRLRRLHSLKGLKANEDLGHGDGRAPVVIHAQQEGKGNEKIALWMN